MASDLPPPGHPMHDILRMTGIIPPEPNKPNARLEKFPKEGKSKPALVDDSALGTLHKAIVDFFAQGPDEASMKFSALNLTVLNGETTIAKHNYPTLSMRPMIAKQVPWKACRDLGPCISRTER